MNNYDKVAEDSKKNFLQWNQEEIITKTKVKADDNYIYLNFCSCPYRVNRKTGSVQCLENSQSLYEAGYNEVMGIFDFLCYSKTGAVPAGRWLTPAALTRYVGSSSSTLFPQEAVFLDENIEALSCILRKYQRFPTGDVSCILPVFDSLGVVLQFWRSDEEFPPSINFLWDANTLDFLHFETAMFIQCHWLAKLVKTIKNNDYEVE